MRGLGATLLLACLAAPLQAAEGLDWLARLSAAEQQMSYQGTFVYERNGSFSSHNIWHRVSPDGQVRERLLQLDGPVQEVLRVDGQPQCMSGAASALPPRLPGLAGLSVSPEQLSALYDVRVLGASRVAGRQAVVLALMPRDPYRYGFELHLDRQTGLPLQSLLLNEQGHLLERLQFTRLDTLGSVSDQALQVGPECLPVSHSINQASAPQNWRSDWLPDGFVLRSAVEQRSPVAAVPVVWLVFADGLTQFSVFMEPLQGAHSEDLRSQVGPTSVVSRRVLTASGEVMVTVVGEVPLGTLERVALSMHPGAQEAAP